MPIVEDDKEVGQRIGYASKNAGYWNRRLMLRSKTQVVSGVAVIVSDWIETRLDKLRDSNHDTLSVNPFLLPLLMHLHNHRSFSDVASFLLVAHFGVGHSTGLGKLFDEKIIPRIFSCTKLNAQMRRQTPYNSALFDEIDHLVYRSDRKLTLLSLKSSRWTIQLTMAKQMNSTFAALLERRRRGELQFDDIVIGVIYGKQDELTDKYRLVQGIDNAVGHNVSNISSEVSVHAGTQFWAWINDHELTQDWIMDGILQGIGSAKTRPPTIRRLLDSYQETFEQHFATCVDYSGTVDWTKIIKLLS